MAHRVVVPSRNIIDRVKLGYKTGIVRIKPVWLSVLEDVQTKYGVLNDEPKSWRSGKIAGKSIALKEDSIRRVINKGNVSGVYNLKNIWADVPSDAFVSTVMTRTDTTSATLEEAIEVELKAIEEIRQAEIQAEVEPPLEWAPPDGEEGNLENIEQGLEAFIELVQATAKSREHTTSNTGNNDSSDGTLSSETIGETDTDSTGK